MARKYITVILPLKLEWEPYYSVEEEAVCSGRVVKVIFSGRIYYGVVSAVDVEPPAGITVRGIVSAKTDMCDVSPSDIKFWRILADYYMCSVGEVCKAAMPALKLPQRKSKEKPRKSETCSVHLSDAQQKAHSEILTGFDSKKPVLLHGVTGAGKTEIYEKLAAETLAAGRNVLYLVPEIAISRQLEERIAESVGHELHVFHSAETAGKKKQATAAIVRCRLSDSAAEVQKPAYMILGTRSSLFLPHHNLGLIIIDEEQDRSYKQDTPAPRYHGRDAAIMLAGLQGANVLIGTATPSLESLYNVKAGKYAYVRLSKRYYDSSAAEVEIIDTAAERKKRGMLGAFSMKLIKEIRETLDRGEQVMILRGRRSYSPVLQCTDCGHVIKCPRCNVSLSLHKNPESIVCHHCGYTSGYSGKCPACGGSLTGLGTGTQKIEEEARNLFPQAKIARLDSDSAQDSKFEIETIKAFSEGQLDILIGTQILTKGFDFPNLTLVAAINADSILSIQDFRADERALQVLEQFKGRCGRRDRPGKFLVQTCQPAHPVYKKLLNENDEGLYPELLDERRKFGFPPYSRVINVILRDMDKQRCETMAWSLAADLRRCLREEIVTGPYAPAVDKVDGNHIRFIRLNMPKDKSLGENKSKVNSIVEAFKKQYKYSDHITIDVDPL